MAEAKSTPRVPAYAWGLALVGGLLWVLFGLVVLIFPGDPGNHLFFTGDPGTYPAQAASDLVYAALVAGALLLTGGLMQMLIALIAFRRGERWSWYALAATSLIVLAFGVYASLAGGRGPPQIVFVQFLMFTILQVIALLVTIPRFLVGKAATVHV